MAGLVLDSIRFVPCAHRRVTYAEHVRLAALEWRPEVIAVELPATLQEWVVRGVMRLPRLSAVCYEEPDRPGELAYLPIDPCDALIEAVRLACEHGIELAFIDLDLPGYQHPYAYVPDDLTIDHTGLEAFAEVVAPWVTTPEDDWRSRARECQMALRLRELARDGRRVLCVLGLAHWQRVARLLEGGRIADPMQLAPGALRERQGVRLADVDPGSTVAMLGEIPYLAWLYEESRAELELTGDVAFDKPAALVAILKQAEGIYEKTYRERINLTQWKALLQYARNLALVGWRLRPDFYELVIAARGVIDGDYGYEVYELARSYPPQQEVAPDDLPGLKLRDGRATLEGRDERFRTRALLGEPPDQEKITVRFRRRPTHQMMQFWKEQWQREGWRVNTCSWPPEDEIQERFMDYLRKRAMQVISDDRRRVEEFSTSLLDGLDLRETVRNWHTGKLYVQSVAQPRGKVGAVVLIFEDEPVAPAAYPWRATLYAENQNESDISFYATALGDHVVGPRICRTEFGGILSIYPSRGIPNIWSYQLGGGIQSCADALLAAGIFFSEHRYLAYIDRHPPRPLLRQLAALYKKHIIYMPITMFSRNHLRRIRRFHILDGHDVRQWAREYIFED